MDKSVWMILDIAGAAVFFFCGYDGKIYSKKTWNEFNELKKEPVD